MTSEYSSFHWKVQRSFFGAAGRGIRDGHPPQANPVAQR